MKVCVIYDLRGKCPVFSGVYPSGEILIRELCIAVKQDSNLVYGLYPEDYKLYVLDFSFDSLDQGVDEIDFTDFIKKEDVSNGSEEG